MPAQNSTLNNSDESNGILSKKSTSTKLKWTNELRTQLIKELESIPIIWDPKVYEKYDRSEYQKIRNAKYKRLSMIFKCHPQSVEEETMYLIFRMHWEREKNANKSDWFAFELLKFLPILQTVPRWIQKRKIRYMKLKMITESSTLNKNSAKSNGIPSKTLTTTEFKWTSLLSRRLIKELELTPILWDPKIVEKHDRITYHKMASGEFKRMAKLFDCEPSCLKRQIIKLIGRMYTERERNAGKSNWFAYELLKFLPKSPPVVKPS